MPTIAKQLEDAYKAAIRSALSLDADPLLNIAQNEKFGDYQSNAAMGLAKQLSDRGEKINPRQLAEKIKAALQLETVASEISIAGPGFINVRLKPEFLAGKLQAVLSQPHLGVEPVSRPLKVVVDYSGINAAKQMHVGHLRSTIIGDAVSRVLEFQGHEVIRQNHIGDWGTAFGMLIAYLRQSNANTGSHIADLDAFYKQARQKFDSDPAFADEARATVVRLQAGAADERQAWERIVAESARHFLPVYQRLGIGLTADHIRGESFYNPMLSDVVKNLRDAGVARLSEGATVIFIDGIETPLIIEKTGGGHGYATTDLAAIRHRVNELRADRILYFVGAPQTQHFKQVFAAAHKAGWASNASLEHAAFGSILGDDGKMLKTRSGETVKLVDLINEAEERGYALAKSKDDERVSRAKESGETVAAMPEAELRRIGHAVGIGAIKYADLSKDRVGDYVFAWDSMLAMNGNTAPYLQYAHARIQSIFRRAADRQIQFSRPFFAEITLASPFELALAKHLLRFADVLDLVARELKPHHLCTYLYELAGRFSGFFENCPVLQSEDPLRASRLAICEATGLTMATGLDLLGIEHPVQM